MKQTIRLSENELKTLIKECINEEMASVPYGMSGDKQNSDTAEIQARVRKIAQWVSELAEKLLYLENAESDVSAKANPIFNKLYEFLKFLRSKEFDGYLRNAANRGAMSKGIMDYNHDINGKTFDI